MSTFRGPLHSLAVMGFFSRASKPKVTPTAIQTFDAWREAVIESDLPTILNVWSGSCPPCKRMVPVLEKVATRYAGKVQVVSVGTDAEPALLMELQIRATPTTIIYRGGEELGRMPGFRPVAWFDAMIEAELS